MSSGINEQTYDVVVVGGSGAGLAAAIEELALTPLKSLRGRSLASSLYVFDSVSSLAAL